MTMRPLVCFGGTFDPPQVAHVAVARTVADSLDADLIVVPTAGNPLKETRPTDAHHRLAMARLAFSPAALPGTHVEISTLEVDRPPPSYTVDTLESLRERFGPQRSMRLLLGSDTALGFAHWRRPDRVLQLATPAIALRPPMDRQTFLDRLAEAIGAERAAPWTAWIVDAPSVDVAATEVRRRIAAGVRTDDALDPAVASYIQRHGLYGT